MKLYRLMTLYCLILVLFTLTLVSCNRDGGNNNTNNIPGYYATATYGAGMYYTQLTEIAKP